MTPQELEVYDAMMADRDKWREKAEKQAATYEHAGCTASAMGWAIKYANLHELALRLVQAKGRFHTQKAFEDLREFISSENANVDLPDTAAQDSASKSNNPAVSG